MPDRLASHHRDHHGVTDGHGRAEYLPACSTRIQNTYGAS
jgi:hypothetical protein